MDEHGADVVVVGAGLAGLTAAATAAGERARVVVLEGRRPGGRAGTTRFDDGVAFNEGAHALYRRGEAMRVLTDLGIRPTGGGPALDRTRLLRGDGQHDLPLGALALARTRLATPRGRAQLARLMSRIERVRPEEVAGRSVAGWFASLGLTEDVRAFLAFLVRLATYTADLDRLPAEVYLAQHAAAAAGVLYLDDGFQQLVDALTGVAVARGTRLVDHDTVVGVAPTAGGWTVTTGSGITWRAPSVVLASGGPDAAARLLGERPDAWTSVGPDATVACLDVAARRPPDPPLLFGLDEPLYLSTHCPPARLAPAGVTVVEVMRYRTTGEMGDPAADRAQLEAFLARAGIGADDVVRSRYLHRMVALHGIPDPAVGLRGRPPVAVDAADGLFVAGDWVGPSGWLTDASMASGEAAGLLAASAAHRALAR